MSLTQESAVIGHDCGGYPVLNKVEFEIIITVVIVIVFISRDANAVISLVTPLAIYSSTIFLETTIFLEISF